MEIKIAKRKLKLIKRWKKDTNWMNF